MPLLDAVESDKDEIRKQWDTDPCGASTVQGHEVESLEFYRAIRKYRYVDYAPWMHTALGFSRWRDKDILEVGVGLGSDHFSLARGGNRMTALDLSREHLRHTQRHLQLEGLSTTLRYGDAEKMPFPDASFDVVYSFGVLHHTPNTETAIAEVFRVLRPGGRAVIGLYHRDSWFFWGNTILAQGIVKLGLIRKGWRGLLSQIEYRSANNHAQPLVKVFSRRQALHLMKSFSDVTVTTAHVEASHLSYMGRLFRGWTRSALEQRFSKRGWYVLLEGKKPLVARSSPTRSQSAA